MKTIHAQNPLKQYKYDDCALSYLWRVILGYLECIEFIILTIH